jgi:hypothetical protein
MPQWVVQLTMQGRTRSPQQQNAIHSVRRQSIHAQPRTWLPPSPPLNASVGGTARVCAAALTVTPRLWLSEWGRSCGAHGQPRGATPAAAAAAARCVWRLLVLGLPAGRLLLDDG